MEALGQLTVRQLAEVSSTPGQLTDPDHVTMVMEHVPNQHFVSFFDDFSPAIVVRVCIILINALQTRLYSSLVFL